MIYVHNTLKQMRETGRSRRRRQENAEPVLSLRAERQRPGRGTSPAASTKPHAASREGQAAFLGWAPAADLN